jgi:hypothetical protein
VVVVPEQMQEPVDQEPLQLALERRIVLGGLPSRRLHANDDVAY